MAVGTFNVYQWDYEALQEQVDKCARAMEHFGAVMQVRLAEMCRVPQLTTMFDKEEEMAGIWNAKTDGVRSVYVDHVRQRHLVLRNDLPQTLICAARDATEFRHELGLRPHTTCYRPHTPLTWVSYSVLAELGLQVATQYAHACTGVPGKTPPHVWTSWCVETAGLCRWCCGDVVGVGCTSEQMHAAKPHTARVSMPEDWNGIVGNVVEISRARTIDGKTVFYETQLGLCVGPGQIRFLRHMRLGEPVQLPLDAYIQHDGVNPTGWRCRYWILKENERAPEVADVLLALSMEKSTQRDLGWDPYPTGSI